MSGEPIKVTVTDPTTGDVLAERVIEDDYVILCAGSRYVDRRRVIRRERGVRVDGLTRLPLACEICGDVFVPLTNSAKLCSDTCRASRERVLAAKRMRAWRKRGGV